MTEKWKFPKCEHEIDDLDKDNFEDNVQYICGECTADKIERPVFYGWEIKEKNKGR